MGRCYPPPCVELTRRNSGIICYRSGQMADLLQYIEIGVCNVTDRFRRHLMTRERITACHSASHSCRLSTLSRSFGRRRKRDTRVLCQRGILVLGMALGSQDRERIRLHACDYICLQGLSAPDPTPRD